MSEPTTTGGDIDYRDPIECEYSLTECRHPVCDCPRKESHTTEPDWDEGNTQMWVGPQPAQNSPTLKLADWQDPRVQLVYRLLCSDEQPPIEEHWEGYAARRIVAELEALNV